MKTYLCFLFVLASALCSLPDDFKDGRLSESLLDEDSDSSNLWESLDDEIEDFPKGRANERGVELHIVNGEEAPPHGYPSVVVLNIELKPGAWTFCGGSLISREWILTAAHCVNKVHHVIALLGTHNRYVNEDKTRQTIHVAQIFPEERYSVDDTDIALLKLERPADLKVENLEIGLLPDIQNCTFLIPKDQFVQPTRLPKWSQRGKSLGGIPAEVVGWGVFTNVSTATSPVLRKASTRLMKNEDCAKLHGNITPWRICSDGSYKKGPCGGDSGGPIFITEADKGRTVVGVVSFGHPNCFIGYPVVYTRVDSWLGWINKLTGIPIRK